jgi:hypothetical protein
MHFLKCLLVLNKFLVALQFHFINFIWSVVGWSMEIKRLKKHNIYKTQKERFSWAYYNRMKTEAAKCVWHVRWKYFYVNMVNYCQIVHTKTMFFFCVTIFMNLWHLIDSVQINYRWYENEEKIQWASIEMPSAKYSGKGWCVLCISRSKHNF